MHRKSKAVFSVCVAFFCFRVLSIILDWQDLKYMIPQDTSLKEAIRQLMSVGKMQYDIVMLMVSLFFPYTFFKYSKGNARKESGNYSEQVLREETIVCGGLKMLTHVLSFGFFQYSMLTLYTNNPTTSLEILNWVWKPLLVLLLDYLVVHFLLSPRTKKHKNWRLVELLFVFFACTIVMDILTSGFMWSSNWRRLYIANFFFEMLLIAERIVV